MLHASHGRTAEHTAVSAEIRPSLENFSSAAGERVHMSESHNAYQAFRARLDEVLRQKSPERLRDFLVAEGQWPEQTTTDVEAALWMMIATSPSLSGDHAEAKRWLLSHGHENEAKAIFGEDRKSNAPRAHTRHSPKKRP